MAAMLLAVALVLNTALYTGYESQTSSTVATRDPAVVTGSATDAVATGLQRANANATSNASYADLHANLTAAVDGWERRATTNGLHEGVFLDASLPTVRRGARLVADEEGRQFTSAAGDADWTLATDVAAGREWRLSLAGQRLVERGTPGAFRLVVDDGSAAWTLTATNGTDGDVVVDVATADGSTATCRTAQRPATVDVAAGTLGGDPCPALAFAGTLDAPYDVRFENGTNASGTYALTVANRSALPAGAYDDAGVPRGVPVLYDAVVDVRYRDAEVDYRSRWRVGPDGA